MSQTVFITGASTGIGKTTAQYFQEKGWNVVATMRTTEKGAELAELDNVLVTRLDVLDLASIEEAVAAGIERFGKIDALVNNAGYGAYGPLEVFPRENIVRQFNTNVIGLLDVTRALTPHFRANKSGTIVNISSIGGRMAFPFGALYHGTKFAVEGITDALQWEMAEIGVKVALVEPGAIKTDFGTRSLDFQMDENLTEYLPLGQKLMAAFDAENMTTSEPEVVAKVIYNAITDGTDQLRYRAGADAEQLMDARTAMNDADFKGMMKQMLSL